MTAAAADQEQQEEEAEDDGDEAETAAVAVAAAVVVVAAAVATGTGDAAVEDAAEARMESLEEVEIATVPEASAEIGVADESVAAFV
ncbi:unnamed protein product [Closterium sp. NIES-54]